MGGLLSQIYLTYELDISGLIGFWSDKKAICWNAHFPPYKKAKIVFFLHLFNFAIHEFLPTLIICI
jgi:hypothetical protein